MESTAVLRDRVTGPVFGPGDDGYDAERTGFQLARPLRPAVAVGATGPDDVAAAVRLAADRGLPVAVQGTGHGVPAVAAGGLLVTTRRMAGVRIDPAAGTARVEAGTTWRQVIDAAAPHGLAPLTGSSSRVGAVSYTLGGGVGVLARRHGYAADLVRRLEVVTADGTRRTVTPDAEPDLFWGLRGGRSNLGVVTALEVGLVPVPRLYGGGLYFDAPLVPAVLDAWRDWTHTVPDAMTSSVALLPLPDVPQVPAPLRGRHVAHVRIAYAGDPAEGERLVAPLRAMGDRLVDTVQDRPFTEVDAVHNEPPGPSGFANSHALLHGVDAGTVRTLLDEAGPGAAEPVIVELRQLGGALARPPAVPSAVGHRDAAYLLGIVSPLGPDRWAEPDAVAPRHDRLLAALAPWSTGGSMLNFLYGRHTTPDRVRTAYAPADYDRLAALKARHDPANLFRDNHNIPPAG